MILAIFLRTIQQITTIITKFATKPTHMITDHNIKLISIIHITYLTYPTTPVCRL